MPESAVLPSQREKSHSHGGASNQRPGRVDSGVSWLEPIHVPWSSHDQSGFHGFIRNKHGKLGKRWNNDGKMKAPTITH